MRLTSYKAGWDAVGWPCGLRLIADKVAGYLGAWLARILMWLDAYVARCLRGYYWVAGWPGVGLPIWLAVKWLAG